MSDCNHDYSIVRNVHYTCASCGETLGGEQEKMDLDKIAESFQSVLGTVQMEDVSPQTIIVVESRLQTVWAEVNPDVESVEDMEAIYPDE